MRVHHYHQVTLAKVKVESYYFPGKDGKVCDLGDFFPRTENKAGSYFIIIK